MRVDASMANKSVSRLDSGQSMSAQSTSQQLEQVIQQLMQLLRQMLKPMLPDQGVGGGSGGGGGAQPASMPSGAGAASSGSGGGGTPPAGSAASGAPVSGGLPVMESKQSSNAQNGGNGSASSGSSPSTTASGGLPPGVTTNAGGIAQAQAVNGISPNSSQVVDLNNGDNISNPSDPNNKYMNVTNATSRPESFKYSDTNTGGTGEMTLQPGQTGTFVGSKQAIGDRVDPSTPSGAEPTTAEVRFEDGVTPGNTSQQNPDVSNVDGNSDANGKPINMMVTLGDGRMAGNGDSIRAYQNPTDDAAAMQLAGDTSNTDNIVVSDASGATA